MATLPRAVNPFMPTASVSAGSVIAPCARNAVSMDGISLSFFFRCRRPATTIATAAPTAIPTSMLVSMTAVLTAPGAPTQASVGAAVARQDDLLDADRLTGGRWHAVYDAVAPGRDGRAAAEVDVDQDLRGGA